MRAVVVAASALSSDLDRAQLTDADLLVAVDGGAEALKRVGLRPSILVGDLDSIRPATRHELEAAGVELVLLPAAKDLTDTEAALRLAAERGAQDITVYGALGGPRLDHLVGNLLLLASPWLAACRVRLVDERHEAFLARRDVSFAGEPGDTVSLLPLTPCVEEVRTEGLLYSLAGEPLYQASTRGISNVMTGQQARVAHGEGVLLVIHYRGR
ncbi:MAG: thiamine diphosphokinase [Thermoleophilia bacterium]|nr:thiamine diphosphokinase [Thermoleophilia bacterium]